MKLLKLSTFATAIALATATTGAMAQVTLYGTIDTAVNYTNHIGPGGSDYAGFNTNTNSVPSRWGVKGTEKISDNISAVFNLESGFNANTGHSNQGNRLFGRAAWVGLEGDWGRIALGRQYSMLHTTTQHADIIGPSAHGLAGLDPYFADRRHDNAVSYTGTFSGVTVGALYAKGRDGNGGCGVDYTQETACSAYSATLGYNTAAWGASVGWETLTGSNGGNWRNTGLNSSNAKDKRLVAAAWAQLDAVKLGLIYQNRKTDGQVGASVDQNGNIRSLGNRSDIWSVSAAYAVTPAVTVDGAVNYVNFKNADSSSWQYVARVTYALSKRTAVYTSAAYVNNRGIANSTANAGSNGSLEYNPAAGVNQTAVMAGLRHSF